MTTATATKSRKPAAKPTADALFARLQEINLADVPVMSVDRFIPRKEQAALCRNLFGQLGIKGISVTAPNYSMAQSVDVRILKNEWEDSRHDRTKSPHNHAADYHNHNDRCPMCVQNREAEKMVRDILAVAFPKHDDRSDTQSDYHDYCWSIN